MKKTYFLLLVLLASTQLSLAQIDWLTASQQMIDPALRSGGTTHSQDLAIDQDGDIFITGDFSNETVFDTITLTRSNEGPVFLTKYNSQGEAQWALGVDGNSNNKGHCVAVNDSNHTYFAGEYTHTNNNTILDFGNISLMGNASPSTFLAKVGDDGVPIWAVSILATDAPSTQYARPVDMAVDGAGDIYIVGEMMEPVSIEGQMYNTNNGDEAMMFLAKFAPDGKLKWFKHTDAKGQLLFAEPVKMRMDSQGNLYIHGVADDKMYYGTDSLIAPGVGGDPFFMMKVNSMGELQWWTAARANSLSQIPYSFGLDGQGNTYALLRKGGTIHFPDTSFFPTELKGRFLLIKYNDMGQREFVKDIATGEFSTSGGISDLNMEMFTQDDGKTFITGTYGGFGNYMVFGGRDTFPMPDFATQGFRQFIAAYDADGNYLDVGFMIDEYISQPDMEVECTDMQVDANGKLMLTGHYSGTLRLGNDTLYSFLQQEEMYVIKLDLQAFLDLNTAIDKSVFSPLNLSIYPNPCADYLHIRWNDSQPFKPMQASIYSLSGQEMMQTEMQNDFLQWELSQLPAGTYLLLLQGEGRHWAGKITFVQN